MMQQAPVILSDEEQQAHYNVLEEYLLVVPPLREAYNERVKNNPHALRTLEHEKLESGIQYIGKLIGDSIKAECDRKIADSSRLVKEKKESLKDDIQA